MKIFCRTMFILTILIIVGFIASTIILTLTVSPAYQTLMFLHIFIDPILCALGFMFFKFSNIKLEVETDDNEDTLTNKRSVEN